MSSPTLQRVVSGPLPLTPPSPVRLVSLMLRGRVVASTACRLGGTGGPALEWFVCKNASLCDGIPTRGCGIVCASRAAERAGTVLRR